MLLKPVHSLYYPETQAVIGELWRSQPHSWYERSYERRQDTVHVAFLEMWKRWSGLNLTAFPHGYATHGASEAIKDLILPPGRLHVFHGEYEGYEKIAEARKMEIVKHVRRADAARNDYRPGDHFWISQPSSIDGCVWNGFDAFVEEMGRLHPSVRVFLDVTYVGTTARPVTVDPSRHVNVAAVIFSLSKPMGVYYHRIGGCLSREPIDTLWGNHWFKNLMSLNLGMALMSRYGVTDIPARYAPIREEVMRLLVHDGLLPEDAVPSDALLLAHGPTGPEEFLRAPEQYRFCLTKALDLYSRGEYR